MTHAQDERQALCDLLADIGPDQPTLCTGWRTADLAAHLVLRERRPDAGAGRHGRPAGRIHPPSAGAPRQAGIHTPSSSTSSGPGRRGCRCSDCPARTTSSTWSSTSSIMKMCSGRSLTGSRGRWTPSSPTCCGTGSGWPGSCCARPLSAWSLSARLGRAGGAPGSPPPGGGHGRVRITAKARTPVVTVTGDPVELTLWTMGRTSVADVQMDGADADVAALRSDHWRP